MEYLYKLYRMCMRLGRCVAYTKDCSSFLSYLMRAITRYLMKHYSNVYEVKTVCHVQKKKKNNNKNKNKCSLVLSY